jgi:hypothetical protein
MIEEREPGPMAEKVRFAARVSGADRSPAIATVLVAVFVGLAIVKPWAAFGSPAAPVGPEQVVPVAGRTVAAQPRPNPSPAPSRIGEAVMEVCLDPGSWRTATIETWRDKTVRVWRAIDPGPAGRPLDPAIPVVPAVGSSIPALGYCAPTSGPDQPRGPARVQAWQVDGDAVRAIQLRQVAPATGTSPYGALFGPPAELGSTTSWPDGLIVFRYEELDTGASRWFGIEVSGTSENDGLSMPSADPGASPVPITPATTP